MSTTVMIPKSSTKNFYCRVLRKRNDITIDSVENVKETKLFHDSADKKPKDRTENPQKFEHYFQFSSFTSSLQSHQILAINRGESLKVTCFSSLRWNFVDISIKVIMCSF